MFVSSISIARLMRKDAVNKSKVERAVEERIQRNSSAGKLQDQGDIFSLARTLFSRIRSRSV